MDVYDAIKQMRQLSAANKSFSMVFMSYSEERGKSNGVTEVLHARLRKQSTLDQDKNADLKLNYFDLDTSDFGSCYQLLLMEFNGVKLELN
jgi:hypothetical protein